MPHSDCTEAAIAGLNFGEMSLRNRWLLAAAAAVARFVCAQELPFTHFTPNDQVSPLPSASVQKIAQDHLGYIWMGFYSTGLTRYDGHSMESYSDQDGLADL